MMILILLCVILFSGGVQSNKYFDLSYSINNDTIYFPGQKVEYELHKDISGYREVGNEKYWYASYSFCMGEHGGTHVDSPFHFNVDGWTVDQIPANRMLDVPASIVDVEESVFASTSPSNFTLQVEHLIHHEMKHGEIPEGGVVLVHTGWSKFWNDKVAYLGYTNTSGIVELSFPGCSVEAAKWLVNERKIVGFGLDTPSVDIGDNKGIYPVHVVFGKAQVYNIENVAHLHLPLKAIKDHPRCKLHLFVLPLKISGGTGGPARVIAYCK